MDNGLPRVKIPAAGAPNRKCDDRPFYFAILRRSLCKAGQDRTATSSGGEDLEGLEDSLADAAQPPVEGVTLGVLLGRGSFGRVHAGEWQGRKVAVKVASCSARQALLLATMGRTWGGGRRGTHFIVYVSRDCKLKKNDLVSSCCSMSRNKF